MQAVLKLKHMLNEQDFHFRAAEDLRYPLCSHKLKTSRILVGPSESRAEKGLIIDGAI